MNKLQDFKTAYNVRIVHIFSKHNPRGGVTIGYYPVLSDGNGDPQGDFAYVSVAYCKKGEMYNRKLGESLVLTRLEEGEYVRLPIYKYGHPVHELKEMFER